MDKKILILSKYFVETLFATTKSNEGQRKSQEGQGKSQSNFYNHRKHGKTWKYLPLSLSLRFPRFPRFPRLTLGYFTTAMRFIGPGATGEKAVK